MKVLLVDDEALLRQYGAAHFGALGHEVVTAGSGAEALAIYEQDQSFSLIVTDVVMPNMSGIELVRRLKANGLRAPVVFTSGYSKDTFDAEGAPEADTHFLAKPYRRGHVVEVLARVSGGRSCKDLLVGPAVR